MQATDCFDEDEYEEKSLESKELRPVPPGAISGCDVNAVMDPWKRPYR